jgi:hypothetical protein
MGGFLRPLRVEALEDGRHWKVFEGVEYFVGHEGSGWQIRVPDGFVTDFASVPAPLWSFIAPTGRHSRAAVVHDYLYTQTDVSQIVCDAVFAEALVVLGVSRWRRVSMYLAVRAFGGFARRRHTTVPSDAAARDPSAA